MCIFTVQLKYMSVFCKFYKLCDCYIIKGSDFVLPGVSVGKTVELLKEDKELVVRSALLVKGVGNWTDVALYKKCMYMKLKKMYLII